MPNRIQLNSCSLALRILIQVGRDALPKVQRHAFSLEALIALVDSKIRVRVHKLVLI